MRGWGAHGQNSKGLDTWMGKNFTPLFSLTFGQNLAFSAVVNVGRGPQML